MNVKLLILVLGSLSLVLVLRLLLFFANYEPYPDLTPISFEANISASPKISPRGQRVSLVMPNSQSVTVLFDLSPILNYGDRVMLEGELRYFKAENGDLVASVEHPKFQVLKESKDNLMYLVRDNIINFFNSSLSPTQSSLMLGIVFGIKQEMPKDFYENLQKTGLMHVVAASGMNITMVGGFLLALFSLILRRQAAIIFTVGGILFYAFMAGLEPSIVRASVMGILVLSAQMLGRQNSSFLALFGAGFFMLMLDPSLIKDVGFQLSFLATTGLIYLRPIFFLSQNLKRLIRKSIIGEDLVTTVTAQILTLPILLINFGDYSLISILVNTIVLWTVPLIMILGAISTVLGLIFEPLGRMFAYISLPLLIYFERTVAFFSQFDFQIVAKNVSILIIFGYYLVLVSLIMILRKKV